MYVRSFFTKIKLYLLKTIEAFSSSSFLLVPNNDEKFVLDLLLSEKLLVVQGTAFNWPWPDHFRVVTLPRVDDLEQAIGRIGNFLKTYRQ